MRINIQRFASWEEVIDTYNKGKTTSQNDLNNLSTQKQSELDQYNQNYNNQLTEYDNLIKNQQNYIDDYTNQQKENQQKQTDYNVGIINQNKDKAAKDTAGETGDAYVDYLKSIDQYGGNAEAQATAGLSNQGFSESSRVAMNITYQNRVSTAKAALMKANTEYDNQIQQALLTNDAALAELALQQRQQSYQLALQGFEYKNTLYNNKLNYTQTLDNTYYERGQTLQNRIDNYNSQLSNIQQYQEQRDAERAKQEEANRQWRDNFEEEKSQFNRQMAENKRQFNATYNSTYSDTGSSSNQNTAQSESQIASNVFGNNSKTFAKKDYYFSNGYQPRYIDNSKLSDTGVKVGQVFGSELGVNTNQSIWYTNGKYYYWNGKARDYVEIDSKSDITRLKQASSWWNGVWHKGSGWFG